MTTDDETQTARAGEYALGLLSGADARDFETDLSRDDTLRRAYADWAEGLAGLDDDGVVPPRGVKAAIDDRLFLGTAPKPSRFGWLWSWPSVAVQCALLGTAAYLTYDYATGPFYDVQAVAQADSIDFDVRLDLDSRVILISALNETLPADKDHELWIIPAGGAPISLGVMEPRRTVDVPGSFEFEGALLAVTVENLGGSPTGAPTTTPIVAVPFTAL